MQEKSTITILIIYLFSNDNPDREFSDDLNGIQFIWSSKRNSYNVNNSEHHVTFLVEKVTLLKIS